jgi:hypothetical protein
MGAVVVLAPDGDQDPGWLTRFQNRHHLVRLGVFKVRQNKLVPPVVVAAAVGSLQNRSSNGSLASEF